MKSKYQIEQYIKEIEFALRLNSVGKDFSRGYVSGLKWVLKDND